MRTKKISENFGYTNDNREIINVRLFVTCVNVTKMRKTKESNQSIQKKNQNDEEQWMTPISKKIIKK